MVGEPSLEDHEGQVTLHAIPPENVLNGGAPTLVGFEEVDVLNLITGGGWERLSDPWRPVKCEIKQPSMSGEGGVTNTTPI